MTRVYLIRHAEAEGNLKRIFQGQTDGDVTEYGHEQLKLLRKRFENVWIDKIYSSDLRRAYKTAEAVRGDRDMVIEARAELREIHGGDWENQPWEEFLEKWPDEFHNWSKEPHKFAIPNGESMAELQNRINGAICKIVEENKGKTVVITSHGTAIKTYVCGIKHLDLCRLHDTRWFENTAVTVLDFDDDGKAEIVTEGDVSHLPEKLLTMKNQDLNDLDL